MQHTTHRAFSSLTAPLESSPWSVLQLQLREVAVLTIKTKTQCLFRESRFRNSKRNTNTPISWSEAVSIAPESLSPRRSRQNAPTIAKLRYPSCFQASSPGPPLSASAWALPASSALHVQIADRLLHDTDSSNSQPRSLVAQSPVHTHMIHTSACPTLWRR